MEANKKSRTTYAFYILLQHLSELRHKISEVLFGILKIAVAEKAYFKHILNFIQIISFEKWAINQKTKAIRMLCVVVHRILLN